MMPARLALAIVALALASPAGAVTHTIVIEGAAYAPASLSVARGDTVVWVNRDPYPHTVTTRDNVLDSGAIAAGGRWSHVVAKAGRLDYGCAYHPAMRATLEVR